MTRNLIRLEYFFSPRRWLRRALNPKSTCQTVFALIAHPRLCTASLRVEGLISPYLGNLLYNCVLASKHDSPNIVEVGAFKGLSTIYLSLAARQVGKRVKSFELFSGLPTADPVLDPSFHLGEFSSEVNEYEANLRAFGVRDTVDLVVGDARKTMLPTIKDNGFSVAFLDVDVYEVMRELLFQLWSVAKGNEVIIIHDVDSPGVCNAISEFHTLSHNIVRQTKLEKRTIKLEIPFQ
jgi:predicted O-methyltransferase YrrM